MVNKMKKIKYAKHKDYPFIFKFCFILNGSQCQLFLPKQKLHKRSPLYTQWFRKKLIDGGMAENKDLKFFTRIPRNKKGLLMKEPNRYKLQKFINNC